LAVAEQTKNAETHAKGRKKTEAKTSEKGRKKKSGKLKQQKKRSSRKVTQVQENSTRCLVYGETNDEDWIQCSECCSWVRAERVITYKMHCIITVTTASAVKLRLHFVYRYQSRLTVVYLIRITVALP